MQLHQRGKLGRKRQSIYLSFFESKNFSPDPNANFRIYAKYICRSTTNGFQANNLAVTIKAKLFIPNVSARIEQSNQCAGFRVESG